MDERVEDGRDEKCRRAEIRGEMAEVRERASCAAGSRSNNEPGDCQI